MKEFSGYAKGSRTFGKCDRPGMALLKVSVIRLLFRWTKEPLISIDELNA